MRFSDIPDAAKTGAVVRKGSRPHWINRYHSEDLGLEFISIKREPVGLLTFHTVERPSEPIPPDLREVVVPFSCKPFRGTISDGISFANEPVCKDAIIQLFGPVEQTVQNSYGYVTNKYIPFIIKRPEEVEVINYSNRGIEFWMKSNTVESFRIFRPLAEQNQSRIRVNPQDERAESGSILKMKDKDECEN